MENDIFQALAWFFCEFQVEADGAVLGATAALFGFHFSDGEACDGEAEARFPLGNQRRDGGFELLAIGGF